MVEQDVGPTRADLVAVAALLPALRQIEASPVTWRGGEREADGSIQMPYAEYAPAARQVMNAIYEHHLVLGFDWSSWKTEAQRFLDPERVAVASLEEVRRLLTLHVRAEKFNEGHFAEMISRGHIAALLARVGALAREPSLTTG